MMNLPESIKTWLLDPSDPSLAYRTRIELLGQAADDPEVVRLRAAIPDSAAVRGIFERMHPDGYWLQQNPRSKVVYGAGVEYDAFATTHYCLAYLSELGLDRSHPWVAKAAGRYLDLQQPDGDWYRHFSCLYGYNLVTLLKFGYGEDQRVQRTIALLQASGRFDGGYLCEMHEPKTGRRKVKSCIRGSAKVLEAFAALGNDYWDSPACCQLLDYFLRRGGIFKNRILNEPVSRDVTWLAFPFHYRAGLVQILYSLSKMGYGNDPRLERAWSLLETKKTPEGKYILDWTPTQSPWKVGRRGMPNKWLTFYATLAEKYRQEGSDKPK